MQQTTKDVLREYPTLLGFLGVIAVLSIAFYPALQSVALAVACGVCMTAIAVTLAGWLMMS